MCFEKHRDWHILIIQVYIFHAPQSNFAIFSHDPYLRLCTRYDSFLMLSSNMGFMLLILIPANHALQG